MRKFEKDQIVETYDDVVYRVVEPECADSSFIVVVKVYGIDNRRIFLLKASVKEETFPKLLVYSVAAIGILFICFFAWRFVAHLLS